MRFSLLILIALLIIPAIGCSTVKTGKTIAVDNPIEASRIKKSLSEARQDVKESRRLLDKCLQLNEGDETKCESQKDNYDRDVEVYVSLQEG